MTARTTLDAMGLPPREALRFFLQKVNVPTRRWDDIWGEQHSHAFMVAGAASRALLDDFRAEIQAALEKGMSLGEFRQRFREIVQKHGWAHTGTPGWRAQIIYETNLSSAYSAGRWAQMTEPDTLAVFPYWQYVHSGAEHPRLQHLAWNGLVLRADDPWWRTHYPPNGWRCGCRVRPLSARDLARQGKLGPDRAPPVIMRPHTRSDGRIVMVPQGIDPGFGHNPGEAQRGWMNALPADAVLRPPPGWPPPPPVVPVSLSAAVNRPLPPPRRHGGEALRLLEGETAADRHWSRQYAGWAASLSAEELGAIDAHKSGRAMNLALRGVLDRPDLLALADVLQAALRRAVLPEATAVYRGIGDREAAFWASRRQGELVRLDHFLPTSVLPGPASAFSHAGFLTILLPRGLAGAAYIHRLPTRRFPNFEMLLARGMLLRVLRAEGARWVLEAVHERSRER